MAGTKAKNIGAVTTGPVYQTNIFGGEKLPSLPSSIPSSKGFVGRQSELDVLKQAKVSGKTAFVLHGQAGVGKTELALRFIEVMKPEFQAHVRVNMLGLEENAPAATDAMLEVIRAFDPSVRSDLNVEAIQNLYVQFTNQSKSILLLDNAKNRAQVEPLNHSNVFLVITSRANFNLTGGFAKEIEQMSVADARALLYSVAGEARFDGKADDFAALTGYLPMALLPLASVLAEDQTLEVDTFLKKYADRKEVLRLADPNRGSLRVAASFDLSYERLNDELKRCWRVLAVFPADFDLEAMTFVCQTQDAAEARSEFVRSHLLIYDAKTKRSRLHDLAREYAYAKLTRDELLYAKGLQAAYYGNLLTQIDSITFENLATFDLERTNIEAGFSFIRDKVNSFAEICTWYTGYASDLLFLRMSPDIMQDWQQVGLSAYTKLENRQGQAYSLNNLARALSLTGQHEEAIKNYKEALDMVRKVGNQKFEAAWLGNLGNVYMRLKNYHEAAKYFEQAIRVSREIDDKHSEGRHYGLLGAAYSGLGNQNNAVRYLEKALSFEEIDIAVRATHLANLGNAYAFKGQRKKAISLIREALALFEEMGAPETQDVVAILEALENGNK